jgi:hypothetical protein
MNNDASINRLAGNAADLVMTADRLVALELAVSWLLAQKPDDEGLRFLSRQANELEESGKAHGVSAALDSLRGLVASLDAETLRG